MKLVKALGKERGKVTAAELAEVRDMLARQKKLKRDQELAQAHAVILMGRLRDAYGEDITGVDEDGNIQRGCGQPKG